MTPAWRVIEADVLAGLRQLAEAAPLLAREVAYGAVP